MMELKAKRCKGMIHPICTPKRAPKRYAARFVWHVSANRLSTTQDHARHATRLVRI